MYYLSPEDRHYQIEAVETSWHKLSHSDNALVALIMGLGKTRISLMLVKKAIMAKPDIRVVFAVNRKDLLRQTYERFAEFFPVHWLGVYTGGSRKNKQTDRAITIGTIQSLVKADFKQVHLLILDEAHNISIQEGTHYHTFLKNEKAKNPKLKIFGMSATPFRADGPIYGTEDSVFDSITYEKDIKWGLANGFLVPPRMKKVEEQFDTSGLAIVAGDYDQGQLEELTTDADKIKAQIDDALPRLKDRKKIVWSCTCIRHAEMLAQFLTEEGEDAVAYHSKTQDRETVMNGWKRQGRHLAFVSIIKEGFDFPPIDAICLCRPTRSPVMYLQICGRGLRISPNKEDVLILDYGNVVSKLGPLDNPRIPKKGERNKAEPNLMKFCPKCFEYVETATEQCTNCGHVFVKLEPPQEKTKNLTKKHVVSDILSRTEIKTSWVDIKDVKIADYTAQSGRLCTKIMFIPSNVFAGPIVIYCPWGNEAWMNRSSSERLMKIGIQATNAIEAKATPPRVPKSIKVEWNQFPSIEEYIYE